MAARLTGSGGASSSSSGSRPAAVQVPARGARADDAIYRPWPDGKMFVPGKDGAPPRRPVLKPGAVPHVGDVPRLTQRPGDIRCQHQSGITPCSQCLAGRTNGYKYDGAVLPGADEATAQKSELGALAQRHPHPFAAPRPEMNSGRGCDAHGNAYAPPPRYDFIEIHRFQQGTQSYAATTAYEIDWGPPAEEPEPWKELEKVDPPRQQFLERLLQDPMADHVLEIRAWAAAAHQPWGDSAVAA
eukprot:TRINITY_DN77535_c0_g1_i1.p2 TRINITY_DN77535_c0_g1~~TRINITY_DN77535_c0_g1_i1.p2  ORF type:complete len:243 (+),score=30.45 TRINITY_DN77535_c0_g1_i1:64-792(+)